jgi:4-hydroxysphinganine ceramide fatty acyl 2-hydroxylase
MTATNVFTAKQVAEHHSSDSLWISIDGKVYDVTDFAQDHPGGEELLFQFGGKDCTAAMQDDMFHLHSDVAYEMLEQFYIGDLQDSKSKRQSSAKPFIDPYKPMLIQIWNGGFSKEEYLKEVHIARHVPFTAPIFGGPLEFLTKSPWWVVPLFWAPIVSMILKKASHDIDVYQIVPCFILGVFIFTFIEYSLHRFVFHIEKLLPDHRATLTLHFLLHGVHHFLPMDRYCGFI